MKYGCTSGCEALGFKAKLNRGYVCEKCGGDTAFCPECMEIVEPCKCGHCEKGAAFCESE